MTFEDVRSFLGEPIGGGSSCTDCHAEGGCYPQVFRNDDTLYATLTTKMIERCDNRVLVVPGDPDSSALYLSLLGTCGSVSLMPHGCYPSEDPAYNSCATPQEIEGLRLWIEQGAAQ